MFSCFGFGASRFEIKRLLVLKGVFVFVEEIATCCFCLCCEVFLLRKKATAMIENDDTVSMLLQVSAPLDWPSK